MTARLLTVAEVAEFLGEHPQTVRRHTRDGTYTAFAINVGTARQPRWRYHPGRLDRWLQTRNTSAA